MSTRLDLYQEVLLLSLRDALGTVPAGVWAQQGIGGGIVADLLLAERISLEGKRNLVNLEDASPTTDPVLDGALLRIAEAKRRAAAQTWVARLANSKVYHEAAHQLCSLGLVRSDEESVLFFFTRRTYPELDPEPEREILDRVREAIFTDNDVSDPKTIALVSIASAIEVLKHHFPKKDLRKRKRRIESLAKSDTLAGATKAAVEAIQAVIVASTVAVTAGAAAS